MTFMKLSNVFSSFVERIQLTEVDYGKYIKDKILKVNCLDIKYILESNLKVFSSVKCLLYVN